MAAISSEMRYNGKVVATVASVRRIGINLEVAYTNGYKVVVPPSMVADEVACLAQ